MSRNVNEEQQYVPVFMVREKSHVSTIKGLAITQLVFGSLILLLGHISFMILYVQDMFGVEPLAGVSGLWMVMTGIVGLISFKKEKHYCLNGTYLGFSILSCIFALVNVTFFSIRLVNLKNNFYTRDDTGPPQALDGVVLFLSGCDFCVSLVASICCCVYQLCCDRSSYEYHSERLLLKNFQPNAVVSGFENQNFSHEGPRGEIYQHSSSTQPMAHKMAEHSIQHNNAQPQNTSNMPVHYPLLYQLPPNQQQSSSNTLLTSHPANVQPNM